MLVKMKTTNGKTRALEKLEIKMNEIHFVHVIVLLVIFGSTPVYIKRSAEKL